MSATATCPTCGWTGGPYRSPAQATYAALAHDDADEHLILDALGLLGEPDATPEPDSESRRARARYGGVGPTVGARRVA